MKEVFKNISHGIINNIGWILLWYLITSFIYILGPSKSTGLYIIIGIAVASLLAYIKNPPVDPRAPMRF